MTSGGAADAGGARRPKKVVGTGFLVSATVHGLLAVALLTLVRPQLVDNSPRPRIPVLVELAPPPPPPPPPPPVERPPPEPPKVIQRPVPQPPPPQPVVIAAPAAVDVPVVMPPPPPAPPAPPAPVVPQVQKGVPTSYYNTLQGIIGKFLQYPPRALRDQVEGTSKVRARIARDGSILEVELIDRSGSRDLDDEARSVFKRIGRFPPVPSDVAPEVQEFIVELPIRFALE